MVGQAPLHLEGGNHWGRACWRAGAERRSVAQTRLKSGEPITLKKLGAAIGVAGQELQPSRGKMAFAGGHNQR
jgi:hypothetical protein